MIRKLAALTLFLALAGAAFGQTLQDLVDAIPATGGTLHLGAGNYISPGPLNLRGRKFLRIVGEGRATKLVFRVSNTQALLADLSGASEIEFHDLAVLKSGGTPRVGFLLGRVMIEGVASGMEKPRFVRVRFEFSASLANVLSLGAELDTWDQCSFVNNVPGSWNYITGRENWVAASSPFGPVVGGSNVCHVFENCHWGNYAWGSALAAVSGHEGNIWLQDGTSYVEMTGGSVSNKTADYSTPGRTGVGIRIGGPEIKYRNVQIVLEGVELETYGVRHCLELVGGVRTLRATNCLFESLESGVWIAPGAYVQDSIISQNEWVAGRAEYDWATGEARALIAAEGAHISGSVFDQHWRYSARLARDWPPHARRYADVAFCAYGGSQISESAFRVQEVSDLIFDASVQSAAISVRATADFDSDVEPGRKTPAGPGN